MVVGLVVPVMFSTIDLKLLAKDWREGGIFRSMPARSDLKLFYFPVWKRMALLFLATAVSTLLLKALGVDL